MAGASALGLLAPAPRAACENAVKFAAASLGISSGYSVAGCSGPGGFPVNSTCTATPEVTGGPVNVTLPGDWTVRVYWPVGDNSPLLDVPLRRAVDIAPRRPDEGGH